MVLLPSVKSGPIWLFPTNSNRPLFVWSQKTDAVSTQKSPQETIEAGGDSIFKWKRTRSRSPWRLNPGRFRLGTITYMASEQLEGGRPLL